MSCPHCAVQVYVCNIRDHHLPYHSLCIAQSIFYFILFYYFQQKRVSAELQLDAANSKKDKESDASRAAAVAEKLKNNPLLKYLREKSLRKQKEKKLHKDRYH